MKTNEILKAIGVTKNVYTSKHCSKLANVYDFLKEVVQGEFMAEILERNIVLQFGRHTEMEKRQGQWVEKDIYTGQETKADKFKVITNTGEYSFAVPIENEFYYAVCKLLGIESVDVRKIDTQILHEVKETIQIQGEVFKAIGKAAKFVSKDDLRPAMQGICLDFRNGEITIVSTDAHRLYMSQKFTSNFTGEKTLILSPEYIGQIKKLKGSEVKIELLNPETHLTGYKIQKYNKETRSLETCPETIERNFAIINGVKVQLVDARYPDWRCVVPEYKAEMNFDRITFIDKVKELIPFSNKSTTQVNFHLNGKIEMYSQDVDFGFEKQTEMLYTNKNFTDMDIAFSGKFLVDCLGIFKAKEITMQSEGKNTRPAVFTDGVEKMLLMPLMLNS